MARAFQTGVYSMQEIADYFGVHYSTVSRAVRQLEAGDGQTARLLPSRGMLDCRTPIACEAGWAPGLRPRSPWRRTGRGKT